MAVQTATISGPVRADRRTKDLVKRLCPGDIAFISHPDLDATAARALVDCHVIAVVNAARSVSGRYPNRGPRVLLDAGIHLMDCVGNEAFELALKSEGIRASVMGDQILIGVTNASATVMNPSVLAEQLEAAQLNLHVELQAFARNTLEYIEEEKSLLLDPVDLPELKTKVAGRHALIVVRGDGYRDDLKAISDYVSEVRPVLIGVDGGADAILQEGWKPDIIIGDMDSVTDATLKCGAELVVHGYTSADRGVPGLERLKQLGLSGSVFRAPGTSEDIAILLADGKGASLIVAVGTHFSMEEFLDKGRGGMASTFLVRLRTGAKLVDAKGIGRLWVTRSRVKPRDIFTIVLAAFFPIAVIALYSPWLRTVISTFRLSFDRR